MVELGIGAGWYAKEHTSYGIPFPPTSQRFDQLAEQIEIITGLWATPVGDSFTYKGRHHQLRDAPALPKPTQQPGPPIIIGGRGTRRTPALAARYAHEFNAAFQTVDGAAQQFKRVVTAADAVDRRSRGLGPIRFSIGAVVACGRNDSETRKRAAVLYEQNSALPPSDPIVGSPAEVVDQIGALADLGVARVYLRLPDLYDIDHLELIGSEVLRQLRS